jgi:hypothetical protein
MALSAFGVEHTEVSKAFKMPGFGAMKTGAANQFRSQKANFNAARTAPGGGPTAAGQMGYKVGASMRRSVVGMGRSAAAGANRLGMQGASQRMAANPFRTGLGVGAAATGAGGVIGSKARKNKQPGQV